MRAQVSEVYSDFERGERKGPRKDYGPDNLPYRPPAFTRSDVKLELGRFRRLYDPESWTVHGAQDEETLFMVEDPDGSRAVFIGKKNAWLHMTKEIRPPAISDSGDLSRRALGSGDKGAIAQRHAWAVGQMHGAGGVEHV